jgi:dihydrofolate reductase
MKISLILAAANNGVIGYQQKLPWHLPADLAHFKQLTLHKPIIMGRKTYESIGKPLPERRNIIITRNKSFSAAGIEIFFSLKETLLHLQSEKEVMVIGGAELFYEALPIAERVYLTRIHATFAGDTFFSDLDEQEWRESSRENHAADIKNPYNYSFIVLDRVNPDKY